MYVAVISNTFVVCFNVYSYFVLYRMWYNVFHLHVNGYAGSVNSHRMSLQILKIPKSFVQRIAMLFTPLELFQIMLP